MDSQEIPLDFDNLYEFWTSYDFWFLRIKLFLTLLKDLLRTNCMWTWHSFSLTRLLLYFLRLIITKKVAIEELTSEWVLVRPPDFSSTK